MKGNPLRYIDPTGEAAQLLYCVTGACEIALVAAWKACAFVGSAILVAAGGTVVINNSSCGENNSCMAKGGKQGIDNEYVRDVQNTNPSDPCEFLRKLYNNTTDKAERKKIKTALKRFNCDGKDRFQ